MAATAAHAGPGFNPASARTVDRFGIGRRGPGVNPPRAVPRAPHPFFPRLFAVALLVCAGAFGAARAQEVQAHGLAFEAWVRATFFDGYQPARATQPWDIPAAANLRHGGIPVNPKAVKYGTPVDLGDALRQHAIDEPFLLVVGFWRQEGDTKRFVHFAAPRIEPAVWRRLWGPVTLADLRRLDAVIKDRSLSPAEARAAALRMKHAPPFSEAIIVLNPKIDDRTQRRLQCSLRFEDFFRHLLPGTAPAPQTDPTLWSVTFPAALPSPPRTLAPR